MNDSFSLRNRILLTLMCVAMFVFGSISSCVSGVTDYFNPKPVVEDVDNGEPIVIEEPKPQPKPDPEPKPEPKPAPKALGKIVMYTSDSCVWCIRWQQNEQRKVEDAGWDFEPIPSDTGPWPRFDVTANGKTIRHEGYMDMSSLRKIVGMLK